MQNRKWGNRISSAHPIFIKYKSNRVPRSFLEHCKFFYYWKSKNSKSGDIIAYPRRLNRRNEIGTRHGVNLADKIPSLHC